jgi:hypothetical protein
MIISRVMRWHGACIALEIKEKCIQNFGRKHVRKGTTSKARHMRIMLKLISDK